MLACRRWWSSVGPRVQKCQILCKMKWRWNRTFIWINTRKLFVSWFHFKKQRPDRKQTCCKISLKHEHLAEMRRVCHLMKLWGPYIWNGNNLLIFQRHESRLLELGIDPVKFVSWCETAALKIIYCRGFMISILYILAIWHNRIAVNQGKAIEEVFPPLMLYSRAATENECWKEDPISKIQWIIRSSSQH